jgi:hypothetical protein
VPAQSLDACLPALARDDGEQAKHVEPKVRNLERIAYQKMLKVVCVVNILLTPKCLESILLRKEVIQPHLPVRLPCYDLALLTDLTLGDFLPCGLDHRLWVLSTQVA